MMNTTQIETGLNSGRTETGVIPWNRLVAFAHGLNVWSRHSSYALSSSLMLAGNPMYDSVKRSPLWFLQIKPLLKGAEVSWQRGQGSLWCPWIKTAWASSYKNKIQGDSSVALFLYGPWTDGRCSLGESGTCWISGLSSSYQRHRATSTEWGGHGSPLLRRWQHEKTKQKNHGSGKKAWGEQMQMLIGWAFFFSFPPNLSEILQYYLTCSQDIFNPFQQVGIPFRC